jgi:hypothetical protein
MRVASGPSSIPDRENSAESITLLRAIVVAHRRSQIVQTTTLVVSCAFAILGMLATSRPSLASAIGLIGAAWAVLYVVLLVPLSQRDLRRAAVLQEMFDLGLFGTPWNGILAGDALPMAEVARLSRRFRGDEDELRDYYLVPALPHPWDVLFCLEQNLSWGPRVRQRYIYFLLGIAGLWCIIGLVVAFARQLTITTLVSGWFVPSLGLLLLCLDTYRLQVTGTQERERVLGILRAESWGPGAGGAAVERTPDEWRSFTRQVQDVIFQLRQQQPRVPTWFFRRFHEKDRSDFELAMRQLEAARSA